MDDKLAGFFRAMPRLRAAHRQAGRGVVQLFQSGRPGMKGMGFYRQRLATDIKFVMGACGIAHAGHIAPAEALSHRLNSTEGTQQHAN